MAYSCGAVVPHPLMAFNCEGHWWYDAQSLHSYVLSNWWLPPPDGYHPFAAQCRCIADGTVECQSHPPDTGRLLNIVLHTSEVKLPIRFFFAVVNNNTHMTLMKQHYRLSLYLWKNE
ncbi:hypothetical protein AVEN_168296-1 [Araneus ventricosus]|uniref:Uncharacterized protein n=1 Tax=Araneus ventricosus TaxID=182803 RepID=A0A4Y2SLH5_ARAVE|nr:hypothetical protein AVEN_168296-1 [Araneus ventricosus]